MLCYMGAADHMGEGKTMSDLISMDLILGDDDLPESKPEGEGGDPSAEPGTGTGSADEGGEKPADQSVKKPEGSTDNDDAGSDSGGSGGGDDDGDGNEPVDVSGYKKALGASRGDTKEAKKQRREAELRVEELERENQSLKSARGDPAGDKPASEGSEGEPEASYWDDPEGFMQAKLDKQQQQHSEQMFNLNLNNSMARASSRYDDYLDAEMAFLEKAKESPHLFEQMRQQGDPAEFAYRAGKSFIEAKEVSDDADAWRKKESAEIEARIRAELSGDEGADEGADSKGDGGEEKPAAKKPAAKKIPKSNAGSRGSGAGGTQKWAGPRTATEMYGE